MSDELDNLNNFTLERYIGQTVTIFTTSGGPSGFGFTGVLMSVNDYLVRLLIKIGAAPECPIGSNCGIPAPIRGIGACKGLGYGPNYGVCFSPRYGYRGANNYFGYNGLGSVVVIPVDKIASFVHNAI